MNAKKFKEDSKVWSWLFDESEEDHYSDPERYERDRYDTLGGRKVYENQRENFEDFLEQLGISEGDRIVEIGCGTGLLSEDLSESYETIALDIRKPMLDYAKENQRADEYLQADATSLGLKEDSVDYAVIPRLFHLMDEEDAEKMLSEAERISRKGFVFDWFRDESLRTIYNDWMPMDSKLYSDEDIDNLLTDYDVLNRNTDFFIPFGGERYLENEKMVGVVEKFQDLSSVFDDYNSVGYAAVKTE